MQGQLLVFLFYGLTSKVGMDSLRNFEWGLEFEKAQRRLMQ